MSSANLLSGCARDIEHVLKSNIAARIAARPTFRSDGMAIAFLRTGREKFPVAARHADEATNEVTGSL